jgi:hypothetical protein
MKILYRLWVVLLLTLALPACDDESESPDKAVLVDKIKEAEQVRDAALEGLEPGNNAMGSKQTLQDRIDWGYHILKYSGPEAYVNAASVVQKAIDAFKVNVVKSGVPHFTNNAYFNVGAVQDLLPDKANFTIECRIKLDDLLTDGYTGLGSFITADDGYVGILLRYNNAGAVQAYIFADGWFGAVTPGGTLEPGTWYHLTMSFDSHALRVYINGEEAAASVSADALVPEIEADAPFFVGMSRNFEFNAADQRSMHGNMQEVRFWDHALTAEDVAARATIQLQGTEPGLTAYWPFDVNVGSNVADQTGNFLAKGKNITWQ